MFNWVEKLKFWKREEPDLTYPAHFLKIIVNPIAKSNGIYDDQNKLILWYREGKLYKTYPYTEEQVKAIRSTYEIPIVYETTNEDEEFEFDTIAEFGVTRLKK